jgi:hypothetical protein
VTIGQYCFTYKIIKPSGIYTSRILVPLIPGVTGVLGKIYALKTLEKVSYLPLKYT